MENIKILFFFVSMILNFNSFSQNENRIGKVLGKTSFMFKVDYRTDNFEKNNFNDLFINGTYLGGGLRYGVNDLFKYQFFIPSKSTDTTNLNQLVDLGSPSKQRLLTLGSYFIYDLIATQNTSKFGKILLRCLSEYEYSSQNYAGTRVISSSKEINYRFVNAQKTLLLEEGESAFAQTYYNLTKHSLFITDYSLYDEDVKGGIGITVGYYSYKGKDIAANPPFGTFNTLNQKKYDNIYYNSFYSKGVTLSPTVKIYVNNHHPIDGSPAHVLTFRLQTGWYLPFESNILNENEEDIALSQLKLYGDGNITLRGWFLSGDIGLQLRRSAWFINGQIEGFTPRFQKKIFNETQGHNFFEAGVRILIGMKKKQSKGK